MKKYAINPRNRTAPAALTQANNINIFAVNTKIEKTLIKVSWVTNQLNRNWNNLHAQCTLHIYAQYKLGKLLIGNRSGVWKHTERQYEDQISKKATIADDSWFKNNTQKNNLVFFTFYYIIFILYIVYNIYMYRQDFLSSSFL